MTISLKKIIIGLAAVWIIFTLVYIPWDLWNHFKNEQLTQAYNLGKADTVNAAITQAENDKCEPFSIYGSNNKQVQVVNMKCLTPQNNASAGASSANGNK